MKHAPETVTAIVALRGKLAGSRVAEIFALTKGQVLGIWQRSGTPVEKPAVGPRKGQVRPRKRPDPDAPAPAVPEIPKPSPAPAPAVQPDPVPEPAYGVLDDLTGAALAVHLMGRATCRWPSAHHPADPDFRFCGKTTEPGRVYCSEHHTLAVPVRVSASSLLNTARAA